jgi:hypothetical protein
MVENVYQLGGVAGKRGRAFAPRASRDAACAGALPQLPM